MALDRLLSAYLSRLQTRPLLATCVEKFGCPAKRPGLHDPSTFPVQGIRDEKTRYIREIVLLMHNDNALTSIAAQTHDFGKDPERFRLTATTMDLHGPKALRRGAAQIARDCVDPSPLPTPQDIAGALSLTDPVFAFTRQQAGQLYRQYTIVKSIVGLGKVPFPLKLLHELDDNLRALFVLAPMAQVMQ